MPWNFFDSAYCISLDERPDRRAEASAQFKKVGLADRVEFHIVERHPTDIEQGIYESHLACMEKGIAAGAETILVFEDDVVFESFDPEALKEATAFLAETRDWELFFPGCFVKKIDKTAVPSVMKIRYQCTTHAYAISRAFAEKLVRIPFRGVAFDDFFASLDAQMYMLYPTIAFQSNSRSDNEKYLPLDRFRRIIGGLRRLQKANIFFHRHRTVILAAHVLLPILVIAAMYFLR